MESWLVVTCWHRWQFLRQMLLGEASAVLMEAARTRKAKVKMKMALGFKNPEDRFVFVVVVVVVVVVVFIAVAFVNAVVLIRRTGWKWSGSVGCSSSLRFMVFFGVDPPFGGILKKIFLTWVKRLFSKIKLIWWLGAALHRGRVGTDYPADKGSNLATYSLDFLAIEVSGVVFQEFYVDNKHSTPRSSPPNASADWNHQIQ